jgi:hypothetical protein
MEVNQHVLSVGRDGKVLIQDLRNGYFPRGHFSACVTAISSRGDCAFQRGEVRRVRYVRSYWVLFHKTILDVCTG